MRPCPWLSRVAILSAVVASAGVAASSSSARPDARGAPSGPAAHASALLRLVRLPGLYAQPLYVTAPPGDRRRLFIVEKTGRIRVVRDGRRLSAPFLDLSRVVNGIKEEAGLLSLAFAPDYASSGRFYVYYNDKARNVRLVEYRRATPERADPRGRQLLSIRKVDYHHQAGLLRFGRDRLLYVSVGDGNVEANAQSLGTLLGKILRIDPRPLPGRRAYRIPSTNPFLRTPGARPEIYAYGLRNPWRFDIDPLTASMVIADVGFRQEEEINFVLRGQAAGRNYGWPAFEGAKPFRTTVAAPGAVAPVLTYGPQTPEGCAAIIGGYVVRDRSLTGQYGRFLYADFCTGQIRSALLGPGSARFDGPAVARPLPGLSSFGRDAAGHIYVTQLNGSVYRLAR